MFSHERKWWLARLIAKQIRWKSCASENLLKTSLYDFHVHHGAKMVPFAGYSMPLKYGDVGIIANHLHVRKHVGVFDVSHMLQTRIHGRDGIKFMESVTVADIQGLGDSQGMLTVMTTDDGGIIDDLIITRAKEGYLYVVSNAGCREKDLNHLKERLMVFQTQGHDASLEICDQLSLLAIQGPGSTKVLQPLVSYDLSKLTFMQSQSLSIGGTSGCRITRCGYTGEDGFELSIPSTSATDLAKQIISSKDDSVQLSGLGVRDSLRLEAGLCLYGNDMDEKTSPIEASLAWLISKRRRETKDFPGAAIILDQLKKKPTRRRVGFLFDGPPARAKTQILNGQGENIGVITSGCPSPSLERNVAMGYVKADYSKVSTEVHLKIRNKAIPATIVKMPFVPHRYHLRSSK